MASEDCAFGPIGFKRVRDVLPGEMVVIDPAGKLFTKQCAPGKVRLRPKTLQLQSVMSPAKMRQSFSASPETTRLGVLLPAMWAHCRVDVLPGPWSLFSSSCRPDS